MVRSAAGLMLRLEQQQAALAAGQDVDPDLLIRLNSEPGELLRSCAGARSGLLTAAA